jgi:IclR family KDG regulon transcriptional repressor
MAARKDETVQAVSNALKILEILSQTPRRGVSELARDLGCQKSTVFRLLNTLRHEGCVVQDEESEKYSLSLKLFKIGSTAVNNLDLNKAALPVITRLSQLSSETIHLCALENQRLVYIQKIESTYALKVTMMSRVGESTPLYCTGVGKVLLAYQNAENIRRYLETTEFQKFTGRTIVNPGDLTLELEKIRLSGIAYDNEEHELGVRCVAAPIFDRRGEVIAALSVSGPTIRMVDEKLGLMRELVKNAAYEISVKMGCPGDPPNPAGFP